MTHTNLRPIKQVVMMQKVLASVCVAASIAAASGGCLRRVCGRRRHTRVDGGASREEKNNGRVVVVWKVGLRVVRALNVGQFRFGASVDSRAPLAHLAPRPYAAPRHHLGCRVRAFVVLSSREPPPPRARARRWFPLG